MSSSTRTNDIVIESRQEFSGFKKVWANLNQMTKFDEVLSPAGWLIVYGSFLLSITITLKPTLGQFFTYLLIDIASFVFVVVSDHLFFTRIHPDSKIFFPEPKFNEIKKLNTEQKLKLFNEFSKFPRKRALWVVLLSIPKDIGPAYYMIFHWANTMTPTQQLPLVLGYHLLAYAYFYGATIVENYKLISKSIEKIHQDYDWTDAFQKMDSKFFRREFDSHYMIALFALGVFLPLILISAVWAFESTHSEMNLILSLVSISLFTFVLVLRLWFLSYGYLMEGLDQIFAAVSTLGQRNRAVSLSPVPLLAGFGKIFNTMSTDLKQKDQELSQWVLMKSEESRFQSLGEISALVAHDLSTPLHVINFCNHELKKNPEQVRDVQFMERFENGVQRCMALLDSLRTYLRPTGVQSNVSILEPLLPKILRLLETRYLIKGYNRIAWEIDPELEFLSLPISEQSLMHIMLNLLSNSVHNLLTNEILEPKIVLKYDHRAAHPTIFIEDNGTGLSEELFEQLTSMNLPVRLAGERKGLGLRLVRKLMERNNAKLSVVSSGTDHSDKLYLKGTVLKLEFGLTRKIDP